MRKLLALTIFLVSIITPTANGASCSPTETMTEGPYYVAGENIRKNITDKQPGTKITLTITVVDTSCNPIPNAKVDIWHTNASGKYSGVNGNSEKFLRGSQVTNTQGKATFTTIFPGWYPGRVMHIHVKVWRNGQDVFTSQFFAKDSQVAQIYKSGVYANRGAQQTNMANDFVIRGLKDPNSHLLKLKIGKSITASARLVIG